MLKAYEDATKRNAMEEIYKKVIQQFSNNADGTTDQVAESYREAVQKFIKKPTLSIVELKEAREKSKTMKKKRRTSIAANPKNSQARKDQLISALNAIVQRRKREMIEKRKKAKYVFSHFSFCLRIGL